MHEKHLRPDEFDLLLDSGEGFGVAPLRAHVRSCIPCAGELERASKVLSMLDTLPDFAPRAGFADRVMSDVQVFEPWHAAAMGSIRKFVPATHTGRIAAGVGAALSGGALTAAVTWGVARADMGVLLAQVGLERFRDQAGAAFTDLFATVLGPQGIAAFQGGSPESAALAAGGFVAVVGLGVTGLRALAVASTRKR